MRPPPPHLHCADPARSFWGALASQAQRTQRLDAWFVDRDGARIGHALWAAFGNASEPGARLGWAAVDPAALRTDADVAQAVVDERAWIAVVGACLS